MNWWNPFRKKEERQTLEEALISSGALIGDAVTKEQALNIPSVSACINLICDTIASLPILLYKENGTQTEVIKDYRVALLNEDTNDTLDSWQWKRALVEDYLLVGAGYSFINRNRNTVKSLHYVNNVNVAVTSSVEPIFKKYEIRINGELFREWQFIKLIRKSKDGITGKGIIKENNRILSVIYNSLIFEEVLVKTGGSKKGFLKSQGRLSLEAMNELKTAWNNLFQSGKDNVVILNNGLDFAEASSTSVEMQLSEHKKTNSEEICKLFLVPPSILNGTANDQEYYNWVKICIVPILSAFETALNKDLLLPSEKESFYFAFDLKQLLKGSIESRYKAYEIGSKNGFLQIDEIRYMEDLSPLGLEFIKLGLQDVLYTPSTGEIYVPNMNQTSNVKDASKPNEEVIPEKEEQ